LWLAAMQAKVTGYALAPATTPSLFECAQVARALETSHFGDVRDAEALKSALLTARPQVVIHMAAQALVRYSYANPVETYATNVMGTVHLLEAVRHCPSVRVVLVVTSDKCYQNNEWPWGYRENEPMGGSDPYSNSKGCAELVTQAYRQSYFPPERLAEHGVALASGRAGNVFGGGDWSADRLIPDAVKAFEAQRTLRIRNPGAVRPWQHVLEPVSGYLSLCQALAEDGARFSGGWNFGPRDEDARPVREVVETLVARWGGTAAWEPDGSPQPHEANYLKLDCSKARNELGWTPRWNLETGLAATVEWHAQQRKGARMRDVCGQQIDAFVRARP
jgi:CDP-glucose 4,6-dehydratase